MAQEAPQHTYPPPPDTPPKDPRRSAMGLAGARAVAAKGGGKRVAKNRRLEKLADIVREEVGYGCKTTRPILVAVDPEAPHMPVAVGINIVGETPLQFLIRVYRSERVKLHLRLKAAAIAAEYIHAKQPQAIHVTQTKTCDAIVVHCERGPWCPDEAPALPEGQVVDVAATPEERVTPSA